MWNCSLWSNVVFKKEVIFKLNLRPQLRSGIQASESTQLMRQGCFFFHYSLTTSTTNWVQIFTFYAYVEVYQVRRLVFDNYQRCPVFLRMLRYTRWEDWSLTITNSVQCLWLNTFLNSAFLVREWLMFVAIRHSKQPENSKHSLN